MPLNFLPNSTHYPGSANALGAVYPRVWNTVARRVESNDPQFAGYNRVGVLNTPRGALTPVVTAPLPSIFSGISVQNPIQTTTQPVAQSAPGPSPSVGASPTYPLNVPASGVSTIVVPKSQNALRATDTLYGDFTAFREEQKKVLDDFKGRFPEWFSGQQQNAATENAATRGLFSGEAQAKSDANVANFLAQANAANAKSIADVQRLTSRSALASDASGYSSARDRGRFSAIADINARAARDAAVAKTQADQWLTGLQQQMAGARAQRERALMADSLLPAQAQSQIFENILRQLAILSPVEQNNLITGIVGPGGYIGDTFGQLQASKLQDLSRMAAERQAADASNLEWSKFNLNSNILNQNQNRLNQNPAVGITNDWYDKMLT